MALSETPESPFEGGSLQENIRAEKGKVLALLAKYGTEGYKIYDDARQSLQEHEANTTGKLDPKARFAPVATLQSLAGRHNQALNAAVGAIADLRSSEGDFFDSVNTSTGNVMDMAIEDRSGQLQFDRRKKLFDSETREAESNLRQYDLRAIRPEVSSSSGGGGRGRSSGGGGFVGGSTTLPLGLLGDDLGAPLAIFDAARRIGGSLNPTSFRRNVVTGKTKFGPIQGSGGSRNLASLRRTPARTTRNVRSGGGGSSTYK